MCTSLSTYLRMKDKDKFSSNLGVLWLDISDSTGNTQSSLNWEIYEITNISHSTNAKLITDLQSFKHLRRWVGSASFQLGWILRCTKERLGQEERQIFSWHVSLVTSRIPIFGWQRHRRRTGVCNWKGRGSALHQRPWKQGNNEEHGVNGFFIYQWQLVTSLKRNHLRASGVVYSLFGCSQH